MNDKYFYLDSAGQQKGPVGINELGRFDITPDTLVWRQGLAEWVKASTLPEFQAYFASSWNAEMQGAAGQAGQPIPPTPNGHAGYGQSYGNPTPGQGGYAQGQGVTEKPDTYLVWAIIVTILCCLPCGIVSIVYASKVDSLWTMGQIAKAQEASANAKKWVIISVIGSIIGGTLYLLMMVSIGAMSGFNG